MHLYLFWHVWSNFHVWVLFSCFGLCFLFFYVSFIFAFCDMHNELFVFIFCDLESVQPIVLILLTPSRL